MATSLGFLEFLLEFEEDLKDIALPNGEQESVESLLAVRETEEDEMGDAVELVERHEFPKPDFLDTIKPCPVTVTHLM